MGGTKFRNQLYVAYQGIVPNKLHADIQKVCSDTASLQVLCLHLHFHYGFSEALCRIDVRRTNFIRPAKNCVKHCPAMMSMLVCVSTAKTLILPLGK